MHTKVCIAALRQHSCRTATPQQSLPDRHPQEHPQGNKPSSRRPGGTTQGREALRSDRGSPALTLVAMAETAAVRFAVMTVPSRTFQNKQQQSETRRTQ